MATETTETRDSPNVVTLVGDILHDAQELTQQQLKLLKVEIREDARKAQTIGSLMAAGGCVAIVAGVILALAISGWLNWMLPALPGWGALGIVGVVLAIVAGVLFGVCKQHLDSFNPLLEKSVESLKENLEWKNKPT